MGLESNAGDPGAARGVQELDHEFQRASACLPAELLATAERRDGQSVTDRFAERLAQYLAGLAGSPRQVGRGRRPH